MKITKSQLKQIIKEELNEADYWSDEKDRPWDPNIKAVNSALQDIAIGAIDHYGYETRDEARKGISEEIRAIFDNFVDEEISIRGGLEDILDEEFEAPLPETEEEPLRLGRPTKDPLLYDPATNTYRDERRET
jgi:hypothetical protein